VAEIVFDKLQLGLQTGTPAAPGAAVAATIVYPIEAGIIDPDLDRGYESPDEDFGMLARHQPGRGSYGLRASGVPVTFVARFEDIMRFLEMRLAGGVVPSGTAVTLANPSAAADDIIDTAAPHGLSAGDQVVFTALTGGAGLSINTPYFVIAANLAAQTFQVSATAGGAAVNFTTDITAGTVSVGPTHTWTYTADNTSDTTKLYTAEVGSESTTDEYQLSTCIVTDLEIGFDALTAPGDSPWKVTATLQALDRSVATLTAALAATSGMETIEGHLTTLLTGSTSTAFASLAALTNSLVMYKLKIAGERPYRAYGGSSDLSVGYGIKKPEATIEAQVKINAASKAAILDVYNGSGAVAGEQRWRVGATGSGTKAFRLDHRVRFDSVKRTERDGEAVYAVAGHPVYDSTLASYLQAVVINAVNGPLT
jgi:hypothetical protein